QALQIADEFDFFFIKWIPDSQNRAADSLARAAIRRK
ncbi:MAG: ribonuclease HI, partial [Bhargavaea sp.]